MILRSTIIGGVLEVEVERQADERGFLGRSWCLEEFRGHGLNPEVAQCSLSFSFRRGTLRGLHYQIAPHAEAKLVRCTRGALYDVALDLRPDSETFGRWTASELTAENRRALYIPEGCAHGFLTLEDNTEVFYQMSEFHHPESARGVRWNDPAFRIVWPIEVAVISERDGSYPDFVLS